MLWCVRGEGGRISHTYIYIYIYRTTTSAGQVKVIISSIKPPKFGVNLGINTCLKSSFIIRIKPFANVLEERDIILTNPFG